MFPMLPFDLRLIGAAAVVLVLSWSHWTAYSRGYDNGAADVTAKFDAYKVQQHEAALKAEAVARAKEQELQAVVDQIRKENTDEIARVTAKYESLVAGLRNRPERPKPASGGGVSKAPSPPVGCTGAELARGDAAFLAGYARDAARLDAALKQCAAAYKAAAQKVVPSK